MSVMHALIPPARVRCAPLTAINHEVDELALPGVVALHHARSELEVRRLVRTWPPNALAAIARHIALRSTLPPDFVAIVLYAARQLGHNTAVSLLEAYGLPAPRRELDS